MKVFIDCGAYTGDTIKEFFNWGSIVDDPKKYKIYAFEPNPNMQKPLLDIESQYNNITYISKAVWTKNKAIKFAVDKSGDPLGSTAMKSKTNIWDKFPKITVEAIDFSAWLKQFENDEVIIKMDIEGAEFPVLEKMIKDKTIHIPKIILVEFHPNKVREYTTTNKNELIQKIKDLGVNIKDWH